jgi:hypothetical protein
MVGSANAARRMAGIAARTARQARRGLSHPASSAAEARDRLWYAQHMLKPVLSGRGRAPTAVYGMLARATLNHGVLGVGQGVSALTYKMPTDVHLDLAVTRGDFPGLDTVYKKAETAQWVPDLALDWPTDVDPMNTERPIFPAYMLPVYGHPLYNRMTPRQQQQLIADFTSWSLHQFYFGEQGARAVAAKLALAVPSESARQMAATQVFDEARHVDVFGRYLREKLPDSHFEMDPNLGILLETLVMSGDWAAAFLGMQIMIEGLAHGSFRTIAGLTQEPLLKSMLEFVIIDEARHVAFGKVMLKRYFAALTEAERKFYSELAAEFVWLMYNRFMGENLRQRFFPSIRRREWVPMVQQSQLMEHYRREVFSGIVTSLVTIGLVDRANKGQVERRLEEMGILDLVDPNAEELDMGKSDEQL